MDKKFIFLLKKKNCFVKLRWRGLPAPKPALPKVPISGIDTNNTATDDCEIGFVDGGDHCSLITITTIGSNCEISPLNTTANQWPRKQYRRSDWLNQYVQLFYCDMRDLNS